MSRAGILLMRAVALLPLRWVRALGWLLGRLLFATVRGRRHVALTNLALCFPQMPEAERRALARHTFVIFAQSWLDRGWLWHASRAVLEKRLTLNGAEAALGDQSPLIIFGPHFYGLDAAATAVTMRSDRRHSSIYTPQSDPVVDAWVKAGRLRFGDSRVFHRTTGVKEIIQALRSGEVFYLLPDMDFGAEDSIFTPFFGVPAATLPSLSRFARLGRARIVTILPRLTPGGYTVDILPAWKDFPTSDVAADTRFMNRQLEAYIAAAPAQYWWVHKRFKTRPPGERPVY
jgi:KDO2-lipid IV(A) lauroyltransferase